MPDITIDYRGQQVMGYLSEPDPDLFAAPRAGIVVIQEWWGLTPDIKEIADRYATEGYLSFSPDLYHGVAASEPDEARKLTMALERDLAAKEIDTAIAWLKAERGLSKVGVVGYCLGGSLAFATALRPTSHVDAVHVYYGGGMPPSEQIEAVTVPVLGSFGADDAGIPKTEVDRLGDSLAKAGVPHDITLYPDAPHAFFNDTRPSYREAAAMDSWLKSVAWFGKYLD
ncbi:MAG: dienelactone hydrolase family protein [Dehalococcoidia bacterium]